jgi:biotin carboxylase
VLLTRDKGRMREHLAQTDIPSIPFVVATSPEDVIAFAHRIGWPIILKPLDGLGSHHIHKLFADDEVERAFNTIKGDYPNSDPIAEKYMVGPEVSVEAVSWDGKHTVICVTDKLTTGAPYFVETGHNMPSALPEATLAAIKEMTERFLDSIGHIHGSSHTEIIVTDSGPIIVESHTRPGGDRIFEMVELVYGIDMFSHMLSGLSGATPSDAGKAPTGAAIRCISLPVGRVSSVEGLEDVRNSPGVIRLDLKLEIGQEIKEFKHSFERPGYLLAVGATASEAIDNVNNALSKLRVTVSPI